MTWFRRLAPWAALLLVVAGLVVATYLGVGYLNSLRGRASEAERKAEAETRIRASRDAAMSQGSGIAAETAAAIIEKLTGSAAPAQDVDAAVAAAQGAAH